MQDEQDHVQDDCSDDGKDDPDTIKDQTASQKKSYIRVDVVIMGILTDLPDIITVTKDHSLVLKDKVAQSKFQPQTFQIVNVN